MSAKKQNSTAAPAGQGNFESTHWSIVAAAGHPSAPDSRHALAELCKAYWYPLYAYARQRLRDVHQAQDMTQGFFATVLEKGYLAAANPERGRFRSFLLSCFNHYISNERDKALAKKRGGGRVPFAMDFVAAETQLVAELCDPLTPEQILNRQWTLTLLDRVMSRLRDDYQSAGKNRHFRELQPFISAKESRVRYADVARRLDMTEGAARVAVHRLRRQYRHLLRTEIARTVSDPAEVDDEIRSLFDTLVS